MISLSRSVAAALRPWGLAVGSGSVSASSAPSGAGAAVSLSVAGLWFSYWLGIPTGVAVILVATAILAAACAVSPKRSG